MIRFTCPGCGKELKAPEDAAGRVARCPRCGREVAISSPQFEVVTPPPDAPVRDYQPEPLPPDDDDGDDLPVRRRRKSRSPVAVGLAIVGVLAVAVVVVVALTVAKHNRAVTAAKQGPAVKQGTGTRGADPRTRPAREVARDDDPGAAQEAASALGGLACLGFALFIIVLAVVSAIMMAVWVVRDCRNRSVENGFLWMLAVCSTHIIGLLVYLASRPHGLLTRCELCGNPRLPYVGVCPHCHREIRAHGRVS